MQLSVWLPGSADEFQEELHFQVGARLSTLTIPSLYVDFVLIFLPYFCFCRLSYLTVSERSIMCILLEYPTNENYPVYEPVIALAITAPKVVADQSDASWEN